MFERSRSSRCLLAISVGMALPCTPAVAETEPAVPVLPPVTVQDLRARDGGDTYVLRSSKAGTKSDAPLARTPRSISAVTAAEVSDRNAQSVQEALQYTAGVNTYFRQGNLTREYTAIRGFEAYQYLDGLKQHDSNWALEPYGLERVDVLRGPASMLYGQGSPGGVIAMTSKRPTEEAFREVILQAGNRDRFLAGFDVGGPASADGSLLYRVVGLGRTGDGEVSFTKTDRIFLAPSVTWRPSDRTSLTVLASYQYDPNLSVLQPLPRAGTILPGANGRYISRETFLGEPGYHDTNKEAYRIGYELTHRFDDVFSVEQNLAYQHIGITLNEVQSRANLLTPTTTQRQMFTAEYDIDVFHVDNRAKATFATGAVRHDVVLGLDFASTPNYQGTGQNRGSAYPLDLYDPVYGQALAANPITSKRYQHQTQLGIYLQDRIEIGRLSILLGGRNDWARSDQKTRVLVGGQFTDPAAVNKHDSAFTVQGGAIYSFANGLAPYVSYSETFFPTAGGDFAGNAFEPTTGTQYEAGVKYIPPGRDLMATAALYHLRQQNVLTADLAHPGFAAQLGEVRTRGLELEARTTHAAGFNVAAVYTLLDADVTRTNTAGGVDKAPPGLARHQASLWMSYTVAASGTMADGLTLGGGVRHVGRSYGDALNSFAVPSFTLFDLSTRHQLGAISPALNGWSLALSAKNLTDERFVGSCDNALNCYYGAGRTIDATLRVRF